MKISVLIIAHNEEKHIEKCIRSLLKQTSSPDEIILLAHNCTDETISIAKRFPISVIPYDGPRGITYARVEGLKHVTGDIILCIDGDSFASENWVEIMVKTLNQGNILVGSWVKYSGTILGRVLTQRHKNILKRSTARSRVWGPSFAFWGSDMEKVIQLFNEAIDLRKRLNITRDMEDYYLALNMEKIGKISFTNETYVTQSTKEKSSYSVLMRHRENSRNVRLLDASLT
jgi:glycosyltransferase involved in cell wall biosynthesis